MLSEACFEFLESLRDAAQSLAQNPPTTRSSSFRYGEEIDALLVACGEVQRQKPWNEEAAIRLIRLAGSILNYHDTGPGSPASWRS